VITFPIISIIWVLQVVFSGGRTGGDHLLRDLSPVQESPENLMPEDGLQLFQLQGGAGEEFALDNDNGYRYYRNMITSFRCRETERRFKGKFSATLPQAIQKAAARKLEIIDAARDLEDLRTPPGNRLEALSGDRQGQHSIRINEQWRVCFVWQDGNANDVEIVDYH